MKTLGDTISLFTEASIVIKAKMRLALPLSFSQCQTLAFIEKHGRPNMRDIARHFKIKAPSTTPLVDELVQNGLVARYAGEDDRRKVEIVLTTKGKEYIKVLMQKRTRVLNDIFKVLMPEDRIDLNRILKKIIDTQ